MIRVVIDTNVLVSAFLTSGGFPEAVINLAISADARNAPQVYTLPVGTAPARS
jgi:predicted nucleic acid-binding protein